jgi:hypothetical protein
LATCREVVESDFGHGSEIDSASETDDLDGDMPITIDALAAIGIDARAVAWDDTSFDWSSVAGVVVRSTWDYHRRADEFLAWVDRVSALTQLDNSAEVLHWNIDKRYLSEIGALGIPVIDTLFVEPFVEPRPTSDRLSDEVVADIESLAAHGHLVVKPAVSAGSNDTQRHVTVQSALEHIGSLVARGRVAMVQPYLDRVDVEHETGLVYIDGVFSHAFSKGPMLAEPGNALGGLYLAETIGARTSTAEQRQLGDQVMEWLTRTWGRLLYARIDMLPTDRGPVIIELELTEPSLYLHLDAEAPARFARAIASRIG